MSVSVSLQNSRSFSREARVLIGGGLLAGLISTLLGAAVGTSSPQLSVLTFGAMLGLLANLTVIHKASEGEGGTPILRLVLSILGGVSWLLLMPFHWAIGAGVAGLFFGFAFSLDDGKSTGERIVSWGLYASALALALFTTQRLFEGMGIQLLENVFSGGTWGLFLAFAAGLKRIEWSRNSTLASFHEAYAISKGEERETLHAGRVLYEQILKELERIDSKTSERAEVIAEETSLALMALAKRSGELQLAEERTKGRNLEGRVFELDQKISKTKDASVKKELKATLEEMVEQLRVRRRFGSARARLDARVQRCFTALERLHLSLVQVGSGDNDSIIEESLSSMEKLSDEIRWRNLSVDELLGDEGNEEVGLDTSGSVVEEIREKMSQSQAESNNTVLDIQASADELRPPENEGTDGVLEIQSEVAHKS